MSRLETFRSERRNKRIFRVLLAAFFILLALGILTADYSVNSMKKVKGEIGIVRLVSDGPYVEISLLNKKLYLNTAYLKRDMSNLKEYLMSIFGRL